MIITSFITLLFSCSANKKIKDTSEMPSCLEVKIKTMIADPNEGSPQSVTKFTYKKQTVFYVVSPCCDKYNIVYDSGCNVLGYPDGGFTGKGDENMSDFRKEAKDGKIVWRQNTSQ